MLVTLDLTKGSLGSEVGEGFRNTVSPTISSKRVVPGGSLSCVFASSKAMVFDINGSENTVNKVLLPLGGLAGLITRRPP